MTREPRQRSRGFSIVEMLLALAISAMLLTATLQAFDASWRSYKHTTESASTHVVSRIVTTRLLAMIRTGSDFGPYPVDVLDASQNPAAYNRIEFIAEADRLAGLPRVTRIESRPDPSNPELNVLWYVLVDVSGGIETILQERPLLSDVSEALFILEYEPGPRLVKATLDLTIRPNDDGDIRVGQVGGQTPMIRLVASAVPRQQFD